MDYREAVEYLYNSRPPFHLVGAEAYKPGLENTLRLMAHIGNPHEQLRAVHVAGTNGKGSTSHLIAAALQASGMKVGLFTSPHLVDMRERIRINGEPVPEAEVVRFVEENRDFLDRAQPSFFETMTAMAFAYFVQEKVDIAVVEVGLGGRLDSTNVLTPLVSVITNIGIDHTEFLGNTLTQIAREKAGIIKPGVPCVIGETHPQTMNVFLARARECGILGDGPETTDCRIWFADQCGYLRTRREREAPECELKGIYQQKNIQTAYVALQVLRNYGAISIQPSAIREGFAHVCAMTGLRGRWETLQERPLVICDTGHNSHGLQYVAQQLKELPAPRVWIIFGMVNDKDINGVLSLLPVDAEYYFCSASVSRALDTKSLSALASTHGLNGRCFDDVGTAYETALSDSSGDDFIYIGGSTFIVADLLAHLKSQS